MKVAVAITPTALVFVAAGGTLATMNKLARAANTSWCGPHFSARHNIKTERG
jgi:hypothetical protein